MRRFVTYLYEYDRGNRGKNCGFVRVDVREGEVQMEVHMRNCLRCGEKGTIYILVKKGQEISGIEMEDITVLNGRGERTIQFNERNIKESGYTFEQIAGIGIRCENGGYLASNWQDEDYEALTWGNFSIIHSPAMPLPPEDIRPMPIPAESEMSINPSMPVCPENTRPARSQDESENLMNPSIPMHPENARPAPSQEDFENPMNPSMPMRPENARPVPPQEDFENPMNPSMPVCPENVRPVPSRDGVENSINPSMSPRSENTEPASSWGKSQNSMSPSGLPEWETIRPPVSPTEWETSNCPTSRSTLPRDETMRSPTPQVETENWNNPTNPSTSPSWADRILTAQPQWENRMPLTSENEMERSITSPISPYAQDMGAMPSQNERERTSETQTPSWRTQMASLLQAEVLSSPQMQSLSRQRGKPDRKEAWSVQTCTDTPQPKMCSYKKITVSDIRKLPSPNWYLCNNNFLLHGFFNYDYLIIKKEKINDREKFYLGVPGVFEKQEKAMAMMFGFPYFESCSAEELDLEQEFEQMEKEKEPKEGAFGCWYLLLNM